VTVYLVHKHRLVCTELPITTLLMLHDRHASLCVYGMLCVCEFGTELMMLDAER